MAQSSPEVWFMGWRSEVEDAYREYVADCEDAGTRVLSFDDWEAMRSEAAYERQCADYYGGNGPVTLSEHIERIRRKVGK